jgi:microsomal dipeptidase-like Zn-dependent dipeptidase
MSVTKIIFISLFTLTTAISVVGQSIYEKSVVILAHDHRFLDSSFDGKNDFVEMINAGISAKVICLVTDIQDWKGGKVVRLESDSAIKSQFGYSSWDKFYEGRVKHLIEESKKQDSKILIIKTATDIASAKASNKAGIIFGTEGVRFLNATTKNLKKYYKKGLRHLQLYREPITFGAAVDSNGITPFGRQLVKKCNKLGIAIDVTHIQNIKKADQILKEISLLSTQPLLFSHQHSKMFGGLLTDDQIKLIALSGNNKGVISVHFISNYVNPFELKTLVKIIKHIKDLVGIDHIALGPDYSPTATYKWILQDVSQVNLLEKALLDNGFTETEIKKIFGQNLYDYYNTVWSKKK